MRERDLGLMVGGSAAPTDHPILGAPPSIGQYTMPPARPVTAGEVLPPSALWSDAAKGSGSGGRRVAPPRQLTRVQQPPPPLLRTLVKSPRPAEGSEAPEARASVESCRSCCYSAAFFAATSSTASMATKIRMRCGDGRGRESK